MFKLLLPTDRDMLWVGMGILYATIIQGEHAMKRLIEDEELRKNIERDEDCESHIVAGIRLLHGAVSGTG